MISVGVTRGQRAGIHDQFLSDLGMEGDEKVIMATIGELKQAIRQVIREMGLGKPRQNEMLSREQVCQRLGISATTLWRLTREGVLQPTKVGGKILYNTKTNPMLSK